MPSSVTGAEPLGDSALVTLTASMFDMAAFYTAFSVLAAVILLKVAAYWFYSRQGGERPL